MKIVFDLDGTLICSKIRLHELFCDLVGSRELSFEYYWDLKFSGNSNQSILSRQFNYSDEEVHDFVEDWMKRIEEDDYLKFDSPVEGLYSFLQLLSKKNKLYICTARQSISQTIRQLERFRVLDFFSEVFVTEQKYSKLELLIESKLPFGSEDWFVGDTGHDINTGKKLGMKTCAVLTGFMSENSLKTYSPDLILPNIKLFKV